MSEDTDYVRKSNGQFAKGNKGGPGGARNFELTWGIRMKIKEFLRDKCEELDTLWEQLPPKERAGMFIHLAKLVASNDIDDEGQDKVIEIKLVEAKKDGTNTH